MAIDVGHRHGLPVVYEVRGLWHESSVAQGWIDVDSDVYQAQQTMHVQAMQDADVVVTLSEVLKAECVLEGIDETKIFVVPNGVSEARCVVDERCDAHLHWLLAAIAFCQQLREHRVVALECAHSFLNRRAVCCYQSDCFVKAIWEERPFQF